MLSSTLEIDVTWDDINHGFRFSRVCCPIGRAIKRQIPVVNVQVECTELRILGPDGRHYSYSHNGEEFIRRFDSRSAVCPQKITANLLTVKAH